MFAGLKQRLTNSNANQLRLMDATGHALGRKDAGQEIAEAIRERAPRHHPTCNGVACGPVPHADCAAARRAEQDARIALQLTGGTR
jgi:hypothetical protein